jgi:hypothetical protein
MTLTNLAAFSTMPYAAKPSTSALKPRIIPCTKLRKSSAGHSGLRSDIRSQRSRQSQLSEPFAKLRECVPIYGADRPTTSVDPYRRVASRLYSNCALGNCTRRIELMRLISSSVELAYLIDVTGASTEIGEGR